MTQDEKDFEKNLKFILAQSIERQIDEFLAQLPEATPRDRVLFRRTCWQAVEVVAKERMV